MWEGKHTDKYMCMIIIKCPLSPCSVSTSDGYNPPGEGWLQRDMGTQVLPAHAGLLGCLWAGNSCMSCWSGTGWRSSVLRVLLPG